jgi:hypothetical protein
MKKLLGYRTSKARLTNNKLILSLDNALTPVMWVIDLTTTPSFVLKVEENSDGYFVLQKTHSDGKLLTTEDLAYYEKKGHALDAMDHAANAMSKSKNCSLITEKFMRFVCLVIIIGGFVWAISHFGKDIDLKAFIPTIELSVDGEALPQSQQYEPRPEPQQNMNEMGVPLSADDFFNNQDSQDNGIPFLF